MPPPAGPRDPPDAFAFTVGIQPVSRQRGYRFLSPFHTDKRALFFPAMGSSGRAVPCQA